MRTPNIEEQLRKMVITGIKDDPAFTTGKVSLAIGTYDHPAQIAYIKEFLETLKSQKIIVTYEISEQDRLYNPPQFSDLETEAFPEETMLSEQIYNEAFFPHTIVFADITYSPRKINQLKFGADKPKQEIIKQCTYKDGVITINNTKAFRLLPASANPETSKEHKIFNMLYQHAHIKNPKRKDWKAKTNSITYTSLKELQKASDSLSENAVKQTIKRINGKLIGLGLESITLHTHKTKGAFLGIQYG